GFRGGNRMLRNGGIAFPANRRSGGFGWGGSNTLRTRCLRFLLPRNNALVTDGQACHGLLLLLGRNILHKRLIRLLKLRILVELLQNVSSNAFSTLLLLHVIEDDRASHTFRR